MEKKQQMKMKAWSEGLGSQTVVSITTPILCQFLECLDIKNQRKLFRLFLMMEDGFQFWICISSFKAMEGGFHGAL